jgi:hypothetical protein
MFDVQRSMFNVRCSMFDVQLFVVRDDEQGDRQFGLPQRIPSAK